MKWDEVEIWIRPVVSWAEGRAQAEADPDGQWHKTDRIFKHVLAQAKNVWADGDIDVGDEGPRVNLDLASIQQEDVSRETHEDQMPDMQGEASEERSTDTDSEGSPSDVLEEVAEDVAGDNEPTVQD